VKAALSSCHYNTFADAVKIGKACDKVNFFWYEVPYNDGGITPFSHNKLRQLIKTPFLQDEKMRHLEERMAFIPAKATSFIRGGVSGFRP